MEMKKLFLAYLVICLFSCNTKSDIPTKEFSKFSLSDNIKFNHLYVVIDHPTYKYLFDSIPFLNEFANIKENLIETGEESWSGKYISGKQHYLEIFKPGGADNIEFGAFGMAFMTNRLGTIDSLQKFWTANLDTVAIQTRTISLSETETIPWFKSLEIPNRDSLSINSWVMENSQEIMILDGFKEEDLKRTIDYSEYVQRSKATQKGISYERAEYDKPFESITSIILTLSDAELDYIEKYLQSLGFKKTVDRFERQDFEIFYKIDNAEHFVLNEITFKLRDSLESREYVFKNINFKTEGRTGKMTFNYNKK